MQEQISRPITDSIQVGFELIDELPMKSDHNGQTRTIGMYGKYKATVRTTLPSGEIRQRDFEYSDSVANYQEGNQPNKEDLLSCLCSDYNCNTFTFKEFCDELGYNKDSIKDLKIYKAVKLNQSKLNYLFGPETMQKLSEEYQDY